MGLAPNGSQVTTRVLVLTSVHPVSDGRIFHRQCRALRDAGYEVTLVAPAEFQRQESHGITILGVARPSSRWMRPRVWWQLLQQVLRLQPDVVHFHDPELLVLVPLIRLALGRHVRIVYDVHEYFIDSLRAKYWLPGWLHRLVPFLAYWMERILIGGVDGLIYAVEGQKPWYDYFRGPTAVVRNLPAHSLFQEAQPHPSLNVNGFKLIYVGLILPERGIHVVLEAIRLLRQQGIDDVYLFLIGPETWPAYIQEIHTFAQTHQLVEQIRWLGAIPHHLLKHYLANADVGLVPVAYTRQYANPSLSTKLFEYMLSGLPIIAADWQDYRVYIEQSRAGLVAPPQDASAFAEAILWLRAHPDEARAMGQRGQAMIIEHYIWEKEQTQLLTFYREMLEDRST